LTAAINYKQSDWKEKLTAATPPVLTSILKMSVAKFMHAVLDRMNLFGRVVLCGLISATPRETPASRVSGPSS